MNPINKKLPSIYKSAVLFLQDDLSFASTDFERGRIIENFAEKYWVMPCFWDIYRKYNTEEPKELGIAVDVSILAEDSIYFKHVFWNKYELVLNLCELINGFEDAEKLLTIPCDVLNKILNIISFLGTRPMPKLLEKQWKEAGFLRNELKDNWKITKTWLKSLYKLNNPDLIIANFEHRLCTDDFMTDKKLWKKYIKFLKAHDRQKMLMACKHYTRFFIEDTEMVDKYRNEIFKDVTNVRWLIDTIEWEFQFGDAENARALMAKHLNSKTAQPCNYNKYTYEELQTILANAKAQIKQHKISSKLDIKINHDFEEPKQQLIGGNFEHFHKQQFDFPSPMLLYAIKNVSLTVLHKLYKSCKYFYANSKTPLCYRLVIGGTKTQYFQQSLQISDSDYLKPQFHELVQRMKIINCLQWIVESDNRSLSNTLKTKKFENIKCLYIKQQALTVSEYDHLLKLGKKIMLFDISVKKTDGTIMTQNEMRQHYMQYGINECSIRIF